MSLPSVGVRVLRPSAVARPRLGGVRGRGCVGCTDTDIGPGASCPICHRLMPGTPSEPQAGAKPETLPVHEWHQRVLAPLLKKAARGEVIQLDAARALQDLRHLMAASTESTSEPVPRSSLRLRK